MTTALLIKLSLIWIPFYAVVIYLFFPIKNGHIRTASHCEKKNSAAIAQKEFEQKYIGEGLCYDQQHSALDDLNNNRLELDHITVPETILEIACPNKDKVESYKIESIQHKISGTELPFSAPTIQSRY
ncbi:MAG: hypothetical protein ACN6O7_17780 [Sphingobacterium sp.]